MSSNTFTQKSSIVPQGFGQPLAPGTPLPKGVSNSQVRYTNQPFQPFQYFKPNTVSSAPAPGTRSNMPGGKRRRRKTTKKRRTKRMRKTRRHR